MVPPRALHALALACVLLGVASLTLYLAVMAPRPVTYYLIVNLEVSEEGVLATGYGCGAELGRELAPGLCVVDAVLELVVPGEGVVWSARRPLSWLLDLEQPALLVGADELSEAARGLGEGVAYLDVRVCLARLEVAKPFWRPLWPTPSSPWCPCTIRIPVRVAGGAAELLPAGSTVIPGPATRVERGLGPRCWAHLERPGERAVPAGVEEASLLAALAAAEAAALLALGLAALLAACGGPRGPAALGRGA